MTAADTTPPTGSGRKWFTLMSVYYPPQPGTPAKAHPFTYVTDDDHELAEAEADALATFPTAAGVISLAHGWQLPPETEVKS